MEEIFRTLIEKNVSLEVYQWLLRNTLSVFEPGNNKYALNTTFTSMPRKTGKEQVQENYSDTIEIENRLPGFSIDNWTIDRLCRVWLLLQVKSEQKGNYIQSIENLFPSAEMNEQIALYSALPLLRYPEEWKYLCAAGIRSNIDDVLEAIMYHNPYPANYIDEGAWNQLIMKAFFTGKNIQKVYGIDKRLNQNLANMLFDYVEERWAAHREEDPLIWRLTGKYLDKAHMYMMEKLFMEGSERQREAAALACAASSFGDAQHLLAQYPEYKIAIQQNTLSWDVVAAKKSL